MNTKEKTNRVPTMAVLSPDGRFLVVGTTFDELAQTNPDGSPILWVRRPDANGNAAPKLIASNAPDPDGLAVFRVGADGSLAMPVFQDGGSGSPFFIQFLHSRPDTFVLGYAVGDGIALAKLDEDGRIDVSPVVQINTDAGKPSELCWLSVSPDDQAVFATNFGYSSLSSYRIDGNVAYIAKDPACPRVPGDGTFRALNGTVSSGPSDNWISPDGAYVYQIYGNAAKLVGYATQPDGSLSEVTSCKIPYNSPQGLAGF
jgi:hypothetical protein